MEDNIIHTDLTFFTNEKTGLYKPLEKVEKIRILVGINADKETHDLLAKTKEEQRFRREGFA